MANLLIPPTCTACDTPLQSGQSLCAPCWQTISFIRPPLCDRLGIPLPFETGERMVSAKAMAEPPDYDRARAVADHSGAIRDLVISMKYYDQLGPRQLFGTWLMLAGGELIGDADLIIPVPLHRMRLLHRRFNQAAILAKEIGRRSGVPVSYQTLLRLKRTKQQVELSGPQRLRNPRGAFAVRRRHAGVITGARILLVDDVITTGATVNACARALKAAGAKRVDVLALTLASGRPDLRDM